jgi:aspartyl-tRNA(Asn)/glutamyl-tRNA(Gln) amidotransferase subunit A
MTRSDLTDLSATELAASIRRKRVSPVELVDAVLARIDSSQASVNAFITVLYDAARAEAKAAEKAVMLGDDLGPLHGVPFSVKDLTYTAGADHDGFGHFRKLCAERGRSARGAAEARRRHPAR